MLRAGGVLRQSVWWEAVCCICVASVALSSILRLENGKRMIVLLCVKTGVCVCVACCVVGEGYVCCVVLCYGRVESVLFTVLWKCMCDSVCCGGIRECVVLWRGARAAVFSGGQVVLLYLLCC